MVKPTPRSRKQVGFWTPSASPASGLRSVEYPRRQHVHDPQPGPSRRRAPLPAEGLRRAQGQADRPWELAAPIRVRVGRERIDLGVRGVADQRVVTFSFRAKRAADAQNYYTFHDRMTGRGKACGSANGFGPIARMSLPVRS